MTEAKEITDVQSRGKWWWPYLGGIVALATLVSSGVAFTASKSIEIYRQLTWKEEVLVISFISRGPQAFLNAGDGDVFLSHIDIKCDFISETIRINTTIKAKEFLSIPKQPDFDFDHAELISQFAAVSDDEWKEFLTKPRFDRSYYYVFLFKDDPILQLYKKNFGPQFRSYPASAQLIYYSANGGKQFSREVLMEGVIMHLDAGTNSVKK
ncbi:MAG TPA: hypothetical protein VN696_14855 [Pyrinomonadaceae bacterium]|nr:hypothetical protein [Pyrinomonadaceae bacterium]